MNEPSMQPYSKLLLNWRLGRIWLGLHPDLVGVVLTLLLGLISSAALFLFYAPASKQPGKTIMGVVSGFRLYERGKFGSLLYAIIDLPDGAVATVRLYNGRGCTKGGHFAVLDTKVAWGHVYHQDYVRGCTP